MRTSYIMRSGRGHVVKQAVPLQSGERAGAGAAGKPEPALASPVSWGEWRAMARATDSRSICKAPVFPHLGIDRC